MKTMSIPGFTAEASCGSVDIFRAARANNGTPATKAVGPALPIGGGGFQCDQDDVNANCVDCKDEVENIDCEECGQGGTIQCCSDPDTCDINYRDTIDCTDPNQLKLCIECGVGVLQGGWICCLDPPCNVIPPLPGRTPPPTCFDIGGRTICIRGISPVGGPWRVR